MNKILTKWSDNDKVESTGAIGELSIKDNSISFHLNDSNVFANTFVGHDGMHFYKVFTYGQGAPDKTGYDFPVQKVFLYNGNDHSSFSGNKILDIKSCSFKIRGLSDWLTFNAVEITTFVEKDITYYAIVENHIEPILIKENNPKITIQYELLYPFDAENHQVELSLKKEPRVFIEYETPVDDSKLLKDIEIIMRFFAILQGKSYYVDDIRVKLLDKKYCMWLFYNFDFTYNCYTPYSMGHRTKAEKLLNDIKTYFTNWYEFSINQSYDLLLDAFFLMQWKKKAYTNRKIFNIL